MRAGWLLLLGMPIVGAQPLLVAVVPDLPGHGPGDEGFAVGSDVEVALDGYAVTDGETTWGLPPGLLLEPDESIWFTGNGRAWRAHGGPGALEYPADAFSLANEGDQLRLIDAQGREADGFAWGKGGQVDYASPGLVYRRERNASDWVDTGAPSDWVTPRAHRIGESDLESPTWSVQRLTLYSSPDSSFEVLTGLIADARERLHLHVYEFRSARLADAMLAAMEAQPGLDVQVLVDKAPVGLKAAERHEMAAALERLKAAGAEVVLATHGRYGFHHLKVLVADDAVAVQSENWVESGVPEEPSWGNRGWGAVVHDGRAADWFADWMGDDRQAWDAVPFVLEAWDPGYVEPDRMEPRTGDHAPRIAARTLEGSFAVRPIVSPDHTADPGEDPVAGLLAAATYRIWMQELDLAVDGSNHLGWQGGDAWLEALAVAANNGLDVRVQVAQPFSADDEGNAIALDWLEARAPSLRSSFMDRPGIAALHNKGIIADDTVVLGSTNGNHHSRSANREASLILQGPGVAEFYAALFQSDSRPPAAPRDWGVPLQDLRALPASPLPILLAVLGVVAVVRR